MKYLKMKKLDGITEADIDLFIQSTRNRICFSTGTANPAGATLYETEM